MEKQMNEVQMINEKLFKANSLLIQSCILLRNDEGNVYECYKEYHKMITKLFIKFDKIQKDFDLEFNV